MNIYLLYLFYCLIYWLIWMMMMISMVNHRYSCIYIEHDKWLNVPIGLFSFSEIFIFRWSLLFRPQLHTEIFFYFCSTKQKKSAIEEEKYFGNLYFFWSSRKEIFSIFNVFLSLFSVQILICINAFVIDVNSMMMMMMLMVRCWLWCQRLLFYILKKKKKK